MKTLALLLFAAVLVLSYLFYRRHSTIMEQQNRLADFESQSPYVRPYIHRRAERAYYEELRDCLAGSE